MEMRSCFLITILVALAIIHTGEAKKCYQCNSSVDKTCSSPSTNHEVNCSAPYDTHCAVCSFKLTDNTEVTERACGSVKLAVEVEKMDCSYCNTDLCNNANGLSISIITLGSLAMLLATRFVL